MDGKPIHYDGSVQNNGILEGESTVKEQVKMTDEMRLNISGNPYTIDRIS
ncbi:hypothetical protein [Bacillus seohaeanensis]|jgi:hypothetical protein|uniref:Uncharacterized protein n=1 Tax=Bacillus seohaeanensis TaxID=284580 RepID=A0ABW5RQR6_9BACI